MSAGKLWHTWTKYTAKVMFQNNGAVVNKFSAQTNHDSEGSNVHNTVMFSDPKCEKAKSSHG